VAIAARSCWRVQGKNIPCHSPDGDPRIPTPLLQEKVNRPIRGKFPEPPSYDVTQTRSASSRLLEMCLAASLGRITPWRFRRSWSLPFDLKEALVVSGTPLPKRYRRGCAVPQGLDHTTLPTTEPHMSTHHNESKSSLRLREPRRTPPKSR
jgi:hypothetical protein